MIWLWYGKKIIEFGMVWLWYGKKIMDYGMGRCALKTKEECELKEDTHQGYFGLTFVDLHD